MKTILRAACIVFQGLLMHITCAGQNQWTWIKGTSANIMAPVYGTQGVPSPANTPGDRRDAVTWTDAAGNLWLFGGHSGSNGHMSDLWKYDPVTNEWTWMHGSAGPAAPGVYGTKGVAAPGNMPPGRWLSGGWADNNGNLWLFGGQGWSGVFNDLWKYSINTNQWTWMKGSSSLNQGGVPGTQGVPAPTNDPGSRTAFSTATDSNGDFWMFGPSNDLWKYIPGTNNWVWIKGGGASAVYGTQGVPSALNLPHYRTNAALLADNSMHLYLFAGTPGGTVTALNDLWRYDIVSDEWTWLNGIGGALTPASYGTLNVVSPANVPTARNMGGASSYMIDNNNNIWIFGGSTLGALLNDVWRYSTAKDEWTWMKGSSTGNQMGVYGTLGITAPANTPGGRHSQAGWKDKAGRLWVYGGRGANAIVSAADLNDLWRFDVCDLPDPPKNVSPTPSLICSGASVSLTVSSSGPVTWYASSVSSVALNTGTSYVTPTLQATGSPSLYTYYVSSSVSCGEGPRTEINVTVAPTPELKLSSSDMTICAGETVDLFLSGAMTYTLQNNAFSTTFAVPNVTLLVSPKVISAYTLTGLSQEGCSATVVYHQYVDACTGMEKNSDEKHVYTYPNPHRNGFTISSNKISEKCYFELQNLTGQVVLTGNINSHAHEVSTANLSPGIYHLKILEENKTVAAKKIVKSD